MQELHFGRSALARLPRGVRDILVYCPDYKCSYLVTMSGDRWPDDVKFSDIEDRFTWTVFAQQ
jgi:hypothetical protein